MFGIKGSTMPIQEEVRHSIAVSHNAVSHAVSQSPCQPQSVGTVESPILAQKGRGVGRGRDKKHCVDRAIARAIQNTLPGSEGFRNKQLLQFARHLKAIPELASASTAALRPVVEAWYEQALPAISTKDFNVTWDDFLVAWRNAKFAIGEGPLAEIYSEGLLHTPAIANTFKREGVRKLVAFCRQLQVCAGDGPFWLSCRGAAPLLGVVPGTVNRWLWLLIHRKVIELVRQGTRGRSAEYRYLGD